MMVLHTTAPMEIITVMPSPFIMKEKFDGVKICMNKSDIDRIPHHFF